MKKLILFMFLITNFIYGLEISSVDSLDFGVIIIGEKSTSMSDVGIYVEGKSGGTVEIIVPKTYSLDGNKMTIKPRKKIIKLDSKGKGEFKLDIKLELKNKQEYKTITDNLSIKVRYID